MIFFKFEEEKTNFFLFEWSWQKYNKNVSLSYWTMIDKEIHFIFQTENWIFLVESFERKLTF